MRAAVLAVTLLSLAPAAAQPAAAADPPLTLFTNATIHTATDSPPVVGGALLVRGGQIASVIDKDTAARFDPPAGATVIDLKGAVIIPGLIDTHSHIGVYPKPGISAHSDGNEMSGPVQGVVRALDSLWPDDPGIRMAAAGGVTTANVMPGSGNVIGGQTVYVKLRGDTVEDMRITGKLPDGTEVLGGLKMANGENPKGYGRNKQQAPFTRMKVAALQRSEFVKAREYQQKWKAYRDGDKKGSPPDRDLALEPLVEVLERKRTVHFHCHRADDLVSAIRLADEFGFELVLQHATEGYRVVELLAKKKIPVSITVLDSPGGKAETIGRLEETPAFLAKAGVPVTINTDDPVTECRFFLKTVSQAVHGGMSEADALKTVTATAAKVLHLDHRIGTLEPGKDADFVMLSGPPFSVYTKVQQTWIDGEKVFDAANESQRPFRDGGFALPRGTEAPKPEVVNPLPDPFGDRIPRPFRPTDPPAKGPLLPPNPGNKDGAEEKVRLAPEPKIGEHVVAVFAQRIHTGNGEPIIDGGILLKDGKIVAVGKVADIKWPKNVPTLAANEVTPGLIDPFSVVGLSGAWNIPADQDQDEPSDPNQSDLRVLDGFNPHEPLIDFVRSNGVTVLHTTPGRVNVIAGTTGVFRCAGPTAEAAALKPAFAVLVNLGEVPKGKNPQTRMGVAALVRKAFGEAQVYAAKRKADPDKTPKNAKPEALVPALEKKAPVIFAAHRADDIRTALRIADEFALDPVIALGTESYLLADELAKRKVPVIVHPTMQRAGSSMETLNTALATAAFLKSKGVTVVIGTAFEGYVPKTRNLRAEAAMAAANGLGHSNALRAVTLDSAKLLGIDKDYGSIEVGKVADLVLYDGDPFENATHVTHTIVGGKVAYDRSEYDKLPMERRVLPLLEGFGGSGCCLGW